MGSPEGEEGCCVKNRNHIDLKSSDRLFILNTSTVYRVRPQLHLCQGRASFCGSFSNCQSQREQNLDGWWPSCLPLVAACGWNLNRKDQINPRGVATAGRQEVFDPPDSCRLVRPLLLFFLRGINNLSKQS